MLRHLWYDAIGNNSLSSDRAWHMSGSIVLDLHTELAVSPQLDSYQVGIVSFALFASFGKHCCGAAVRTVTDELGKTSCVLWT